MKYPTREGIAIPPYELGLPLSRLNIENQKHFNTHHNEWERKQMGRFAITQTLRDLTRMQFQLPRDLHRWIHQRYEPPAFPTPQQALNEVMDAYENDETLRIFNTRQNKYFEHPIPDRLIQRFKQDIYS